MKIDIFFTLLPNMFINYSSLTATILAVLSLIALLLIMRRLKINVKLVVKWTTVWTGLALAVAAIGVAVSYIISMVTGIEFKITYMPRVIGADFIALAAVVLTSILSSQFYPINWLEIEKILRLCCMAGPWFNEILLVIFTIALPGGSYLSYGQ